MAITTSFILNWLSSLETQDLIRHALFGLAYLVIVDIVWRIIYYRYFHPLRHYPGPWLASITRLWLAWHHFRGTELQTQWMLIKKHGMSTPSTFVPFFFFFFFFFF
jgi:hypothetical protein